ncbi:MAG TPA: MlaD family protein [Verrucomicrobiae bacterium]|nr:MlaD family protein [Verrucomicrobiae bacterium]
MALQDLTPQLRTRLNRMERAVGWFVLLATLLLLFGFGYYLYKTAERKGWFEAKAPFYMWADRATGLKAGDPVQMMGFDVGEITKVTAAAADDWEHNVYLEFVVKNNHKDKYIGYLWTQGSRAKLTSADLFGKRVVEVTRGTNGYPIYLFNPLRVMAVADAQSTPDLDKWLLAQEIYDATTTNVVLKAYQPLSHDLLQKVAAYTNQIWVADSRKEGRRITGVWNDRTAAYDVFTGKIYWMPTDESPALSERAERLVSQVEAALPNFLGLTNDISRVLSNSTTLTSNLNVVAENARPLVTNLSFITANLRNPEGSLGEWLIPTNTHAQLDTALTNANATLVTANTNIANLAEELSRSLDNLANITSNLNNQVEVNSNILTHISDIVVHSDQFIQGLKRHWLLRSAFKTPKTNAPPARRVEPFHSPKAESQ